jgi:hypothetical protein
MASVQAVPLPGLVETTGQIVLDVSGFGGLTKEYHVDLDPAKLTHYAIPHGVPDCNRGPSLTMNSWPCVVGRILGLGPQEHRTFPQVVAHTVARGIGQFQPTTAARRALVRYRAGARSVAFIKALDEHGAPD